MRKEYGIAGKRCVRYGDEEAGVHLIQPADSHEWELLDREWENLRRLAPREAFSLTAFLVEDWNRELSPWEAPPVFGSQGFGSGAAETLAWIEEALLPACGNGSAFLGGYSLAGLFALWSACQTERFAGVAAVSPSVWFPGWAEYAGERRCLSPRVYLSLGDREERTRNARMASVGERIRAEYVRLARTCDCTLERNPGNHFREPELRTARGFAWLLAGCPAEKQAPDTL